MDDTRDTDLGNTTDPDEIIQEIQNLVNEEPQTVRDVHEEIGESVGLTRDQTEYRLEQLAEDSDIKAKKSSGKTGPRIFWK